MEYFIQELMNDNDMILTILERNVDLTVILLNCIQKRHVPRVTNFTETIVPLFSSKDLCMQFRIDRGTFEIIMQAIDLRLISNNVCGKEQVVPDIFMVHTEPGIDARRSQFIWHFEINCSWDNNEHVSCLNQTFKNVRVIVFDYSLILENS